jgi:hypothetical protein
MSCNFAKTLSTVSQCTSGSGRRENTVIWDHDIPVLLDKVLENIEILYQQLRIADYDLRDISRYSFRCRESIQFV